MSFHAFWLKKVAANPRLADSEVQVTLSVQELQKQLAGAFRAGAAQNKESSDPFGFGRLFGDRHNG